MTAPAQITLYKKILTYCAPCIATERKLTEKHLPFEAIAVDTEENADLLSDLALEGWAEAPIVKVRFPDGHKVEWSGYRPDLLDEVERDLIGFAQEAA